MTGGFLQLCAIMSPTAKASTFYMFTHPQPSYNDKTSSQDYDTMSSLSSLSSLICLKYLCPSPYNSMQMPLQKLNISPIQEGEEDCSNMSPSRSCVTWTGKIGLMLMLMQVIIMFRASPQASLLLQRSSKDQKCWMSKVTILCLIIVIYDD